MVIRLMQVFREKRYIDSNQMEYPETILPQTMDKVNNEVIETPECPICFTELTKQNKTVFGCISRILHSIYPYCPICRRDLYYLFAFSKETMKSLEIHTQYYSTILIDCRYINWTKIHPFIDIKIIYGLFYSSVVIFMIIVLLVPLRTVTIQSPFSRKIDL